MLRRALIGALLAFTLVGGARAEGQDAAAGPMPLDIPVEATLELPKGGALEGGARALAFSADGQMLCAGTCGGRVIICAIGASNAPGGWREIFHHSGGVAGIVALGSGAQGAFASAGDDGIVALVTAAQLAQEKAPQAVTLDAGIGPLTALARLDEGRLVIGSSNGSLAIVHVDPERGALSIEKALANAHEGPISGLVALPAGHFASVGWDGRARVGDGATLKEVRAAKLSKVELTSIAASADGKTLLVGAWERGVRVLDAGTLKAVCDPIEAHPGACSALVAMRAAGPHGARIARLISAGPADECVVICEADPKTGKLAPGLRDRFPVGPAALALTPDESRVAVGTWLGHVMLLRLSPSGAGGAADKKEQGRDRHDAKPGGSS